ncbi:connector enhancer of kinase suppressor of ras 1-like [Xenia sp. Carnegie-2017]|uniref:connector enhancer of kinase suppressor of ras 1-like n=1 Tax=Xenia sp. Carnegie-2017 TaxID=2897299 RepID=UPI001F0343F8|nr:connector enhancer of kinase suppressor of ras 1-like [Xenia sp. Carnegie-2017]
MKIGSVKNVTVGGTSAKQVEVYCVRRREKKSQVDGAPNKRISCIDLGDAEREGWLTKKSGGHGLAPTRWRRHWCVLKDNHLYYYKTAFDKEAVGMIQIAGYKMSPAPEQKKPFCFKCEKEGGKGYFFYADNELERENWINILNISSRGERKFREPGLGQINQSTERERKTSDSSSLRISTSNVRPRTSSVLAGIRFDYHDDDDDHVGLKRQSIAIVSNEGTNVNGKNVDPEPSKAEEKTNGQNILKIAENYGEDAGQDVFLDTKDKNILVNGNSDIITKSSNESSTKSLDTSIKMDEEIKESSYSSKSDKGGQGAKY